MPELPEVENVCRQLCKNLLGRIFQKIVVLNAGSVHSSNLKENLIENTIIDVSRRGKLIIIHLSNDKYLTCHLRMTGQLLIVSSLNNEFDGIGKHTRVVFYFDDGVECHFNDVRRFGYLKVVNKAELELLKKNNYGIEPFTPNYTKENFYKIFENRKTSLKAILLNQRLIAGLGNIYVDEVCFASGVHPAMSVSKLTHAELDLLYRNIPEILQKAIDKGGTTFYNFSDSENNRGQFVDSLMVFQRHGQKCKVCGTIIGKIRVAGRGTHFCAKCQVLR